MNENSNPPPPPPAPPSDPVATAFSAAPPPPPPQPDAPMPYASAPGNEGSGLAPNIAAGLAELFAPLGGIVFLLLEKRDPYVRFHAMQSTVFGAAMIILGIISAILNFVLFHIPIIGWLIMLVLGFVFMLLSLGALVLWLLATFKAFNGVEWEIPYIGKFARQQLAKSGSLGPLA